MHVLKSTRPPWGDYGSILWHGMVEERSTEDSPLRLERSGPFVPPISFPWPTVVVTEPLRRELRRLDPTGCVLRPVVLSRVVAIDWHEWDAGAEDPPRYPASGEPEDYILRGRHSPEAGSALPALWELHVPESPGLQVEGGGFDPSCYSGQDICRGSRWGHVFVSDRFAAWLRTMAPQWVMLHPARFVS